VSLLIYLNRKQFYERRPLFVLSMEEREKLCCEMIA